MSQISRLFAIPRCVRGRQLRLTPNYKERVCRHSVRLPLKLSLTQNAPVRQNAKKYYWDPLPKHPAREENLLPTGEFQVGKKRLECESWQSRGARQKYTPGEEVHGLHRSVAPEKEEEGL